MRNEALKVDTRLRDPKTKPNAHYLVYAAPRPFLHETINIPEKETAVGCQGWNLSMFDDRIKDTTKKNCAAEERKVFNDERSISSLFSNFPVVKLARSTTSIIHLKELFAFKVLLIPNLPLQRISQIPSSLA